MATRESHPPQKWHIGSVDHLRTLPFSGTDTICEGMELSKQLFPI